jgi:hypothetical protein
MPTITSKNREEFIEKEMAKKELPKKDNFSPMSDEKGKPLILYHGTKSNIVGKINPSKTGEFGPGVYLTDDPSMAQYHANKAIGNESPNIHPVHVDFKNPKHLTKLEWLKLNEKKTPSEIHKMLVKKGHDSIIGSGLTGEKQYLALNSNQVKSIFEK